MERINENGRNKKSFSFFYTTSSFGGRFSGHNIPDKNTPFTTLLLLQYIRTVPSVTTKRSASRTAVAVRPQQYIYLYRCKRSKSEFGCNDIILMAEIFTCTKSVSSRNTQVHNIMIVSFCFSSVLLRATRNIHRSPAKSATAKRHRQCGYILLYCTDVRAQTIGNRDNRSLICDNRRN